jgi:Leucine-rich repeat (LRR) protein
MKLIFVAIAISLLSSCSDYEITLNDQPILLRKPVPVDVTVFDSGLSWCLSETLKMQSHTDISDLNTLDCSFAGIKILDGLEQFQGLVRVKLNGNELSDIGPLLSLGQLTIADLENNNNIPCEQLQVLQGYIGNGLTHSQDCKL